MILRKLDDNNARIIGAVMAQSVALDFYMRKVDSLLSEFSEISRRIQVEGPSALANVSRSDGVVGRTK